MFNFKLYELEVKFLYLFFMEEIRFAGFFNRCGHCKSLAPEVMII